MRNIKTGNKENKKSNQEKEARPKYISSKPQHLGQYFFTGLSRCGNRSHLCQVECHDCKMTVLLGNRREKREQQEAWHGTELSPDSVPQLWHQYSPLGPCALCPPMPSMIPATCETTGSHPWPRTVLVLPVFGSPCSTAWSCSCTKSSLLSAAVSLS